MNVLVWFTLVVIKGVIDPSPLFLNLYFYYNHEISIRVKVVLVEVIDYLSGYLGMVNG